jgi:hypothetical protein
MVRNSIPAEDKKTEHHNSFNERIMPGDWFFTGTTFSLEKNKAEKRNILIPG